MSRDLDLGGGEVPVEVSEMPMPVDHDRPVDPNDPPAEPERSVATSEPVDVPPPRPSWWPHVRLVPRTLSGRLIAGVTALVLVLVLAMGAATYALLRPFLYNQLDQQLRPLASNNASRINTCLGTPVCVLGNRYGFHGALQQWIGVYDANGEQHLNLQAAPDYVLLTMSDSDTDRVIGSPGQAHTVPSIDGTELRVIAQAPTPGVFVVTGLSTSEVTNTMHRVVVIELGIGLGLLVVAVGATFFGVRFSLRPIRRVTSTAREVTAELSPEGAGLDRRVPVAPHESQSEAGQMAESVNTLLGAVETQFAARVASEERMRQFMADASHELRTPLTSIRGYAELARMRRANGAADVDTESDTFDRIESEGTRMSRLVEDLLLLARSDQGSVPHIEPIDIHDLIADAVEGVQAAHPDRRIDVVVDPDVQLSGDYDQLLRVLRNLMTNAAVHTAPAGPIRVRAYRDGGDSVIRVDDSGPGLRPEEAAQVFDRFWRADKARTRARGGTGLGMSIVRSIVEAHGGSVRFDSAVATGSTVTVRLPPRPVPTPD
jgi:two-component system, OmpR family, sensor kinase